MVGAGREINVVVTGAARCSRRLGHVCIGLGRLGALLMTSFAAAHIGWINDFGWTMVNVPDNNVGMVRSGINFAL